MSVTLWVVIAVGVWAVCSVLSYGLTLAYFQRKFPIIADESYESDVRFARGTALLGPISLVVALLFPLLHGGGYYGFQWRKEVTNDRANDRN